MAKLGRPALVLLIAMLVAAFFWFDLQHWLTLDALKGGLNRFEDWRAAAPLKVGFGFFALYVLVTAVSLPGAAILTLAAGALFGLGWGTLIVSFASSIGATLAFLAARYLLRDWVQQRFATRLGPINKGIERDGAFYLFALRLVPAFPFFLINLLMGLTPIRTPVFYAVSQAGMLAGTLVYVNAGTQLARIERLSQVVSPAVLLSFALLGVFPLLAKAILRWLQRRRVYAQWQRPKRFERNLVVIGAGSAGLVAAYIAAASKASVTLVEANKMGGDCLNYGCVPSKALIRSATLAHQMRHASHYGLQDTEPRLDFRQVMARVQAAIASIEPHDSIERYTGLGVDVVKGYATLVDPWTVEIRDAGGARRRQTTRSVIIAAGARPTVPPLPGLEAVGYVTSDTLWDEFAQLEQAPRRLVVLGGGPIGCELAQAFARLGSEVTQIEMAPRLMGREDEEVSGLVRAALQHDGVQVLTGHKALRCEKFGEGGGGKAIVVEHDGAERRIEFDALLCAVGRTARLEGYGLDALGIATGRTVETNEYLQTKFPNILAAGDVAGPYQFTHTASHQAWYATVNGLFGRFWRFKVDNRVIPWCTFVAPEVARVGLNEQEARENKIAVEVTRYELRELDRAITDSAENGFVKVLTPPGKDRILGVTIVGEHAGDLLAEFVLAMKQGLGLKKILGTIHTYPTLAEANKNTAGQWQRKHVPASAIEWAARFHAWQRG